MSFSYNRLWKLLIDRNMTKEQLRITLSLSPNTIARMGKAGKGNVSMDALDKICNYFECALEDIVEHVPNQK